MLGRGAAVVALGRWIRRSSSTTENITIQLLGIIQGTMSHHHGSQNVATPFVPALSPAVWIVIGGGGAALVYFGSHDDDDKDERLWFSVDSGDMHRCSWGAVAVQFPTRVHSKKQNS